MATNIKDLGLPKIVLSCDGYRLIGQEIKDEANYDLDWCEIVEIGNVDVSCQIVLIAESCSTDALGSICWSECRIAEAKRAYLDDAIHASILTGKKKKMPAAARIEKL